MLQVRTTINILLQFLSFSGFFHFACDLPAKSCWQWCSIFPSLTINLNNLLSTNLKETYPSLHPDFYIRKSFQDLFYREIHRETHWLKVARAIIPQLPKARTICCCYTQLIQRIFLNSFAKLHVLKLNLFLSWRLSTHFLTVTIVINKCNGLECFSLGVPSNPLETYASVAVATVECIACTKLITIRKEGITAGGALNYIS